MNQNPDPRSTPSAPAPSFWESQDPATAPQQGYRAAAPVPVDHDTPARPRRSGRGWIVSSFVMSAVAALGAIVLPHFAAFLAVAAALSAWNGIRLSTGTPKLGVAALVASILVFVGCVVYTIVSVQLGFSYWEDLP